MTQRKPCDLIFLSLSGPSSTRPRRERECGAAEVHLAQTSTRKHLRTNNHNNKKDTHKTTRTPRKRHAFTRRDTNHEARVQPGGERCTRLHLGGPLKKLQPLASPHPRRPQHDSGGNVNTSVSRITILSNVIMHRPFGKRTGSAADCTSIASGAPLSHCSGGKSCRTS